MTELTHLSLFSGIGGLDLAAEATGFQTVGQCEWADYPTKVLEKHWPNIPRWRDIQTLTGDDFYARTGRRSVTVISGGFPCQPFSVAGKRRGKKDDRYLWPEMCRVVSEIRPAWVIGENVPGIVNLALDTVLSDLEIQGYACQTFIIPAAGVDAPHRRDRIAIVGYSEHNGLSAATVARSTKKASYNESERQNATSKSAGASQFGNSQNVADTNKQGLQGRQRGKLQKCSGQRIAGKSNSPLPDTESTECQRERRETREWWSELGRGGWWPVEPDVGRVANGIPSRVDRLKCLGNAVVPQQFYPFFKYIAEIERQLS